MLLDGSGKINDLKARKKQISMLISIQLESLKGNVLSSLNQIPAPKKRKWTSMTNLN